MRFFHHYVYKVKGYNIEKCLNKINNNKIKLKNIKKELNSANFEARKKHSKKIENILFELGIKIENRTSVGFLYNLKCFSKRFGILFSLTILSFFAVFSQKIVLKFEIIGNETISSSQIIEAINKNNINYFSLNNFDKTQLEKNILAEIEELSMVSVITKGCSLIVNVQEKVIPEENFESIKASFNGKITKIELIQGTLNVSVGDYVREGDELVLPFITDASGQIKEISPKANIYAEVYVTADIAHTNVRVEKVRTGRTFTFKNLSFLGQSIYVTKESHDFRLFETEKRERYFTNFLLPFKLEETVYYELEEKVYEENFDEVKPELLEKLKTALKSELQSDDVILDEFEFYEKKGEINRLSYTYVVERNISLQ